MAEVLKLTDGSTNISFLNVSGIGGQTNGWVPATPKEHDNLYERAKETIAVTIRPSSEDNLAVQLIALNKLFRKAWQFHNTTWQTTPVYLEAQGPNETGPRYALLYDGRFSGAKSMHEYISEVNSGIVPSAVITLEREAGWRDAVPGNTPSASTLTASSGPASPTEVHVTNHLSKANSTVLFIYNFDDNLASFSSNLTGGAFTYFEVSGSTPAVDDIIYFGDADFLMPNLVFNFGGGGDNFTVVWEYYNGSWTALTEGTEFTTLGIIASNFRPNNGRGLFSLARISDATTVAINGQTLYWIRCKISAVGATAGRITQVTDEVYSQLENHVEIPAAAIDGDLPPHTILSHLHPNGSDSASTPEFGTTSRIIMGLRSQGLSGDNLFPGIITFNVIEMALFGAAITRTLGTDATSVTDLLGPTAEAVNIDFAGDETLISRVAMEFDHSAEDMFPAFGGIFRAFLRVKQASGAAGDCSVKLETRLRSSLLSSSDEITIASEEITLQAVDKVLEVVDMGIISVGGDQLIDTDTNPGFITFDVFAARSTGASTLRIYDIVLIPIDEWSATFDAPIEETDSVGLSLKSASQLEIDSGVVKPRNVIGASLDLANNIKLDYLAGTWSRFGPALNKIEPSKQYRIYYFMMEYNTAYGTGPFLAPIGKHLVVEVRAVDRYATVRGGD